MAIMVPIALVLLLPRKRSILLSTGRLDLRIYNSMGIDRCGLEETMNYVFLPEFLFHLGPWIFNPFKGWACVRIVSV